MSTLYMSGPITDVTYGNATSWYDAARKMLNHKIRTVKPMRAKNFLAAAEHGTVGDVVNADPRAFNHLQAAMLMPRHIAIRDNWDVSQCDAVLCNQLDAERLSVGSILEIGLAHAYNKPIVLVTREDDRALNNHPMVQHYVLANVHSLQAACVFLNALLDPYE